MYDTHLHLPLTMSHPPHTPFLTAVLRTPSSAHGASLRQVRRVQDVAAEAAEGAADPDAADVGGPLLPGGAARRPAVLRRRDRGSRREDDGGQPAYGGRRPALPHLTPAALKHREVPPDPGSFGR